MNRTLIRLSHSVALSVFRGVAPLPGLAASSLSASPALDAGRFGGTRAPQPTGASRRRA